MALREGRLDVPVADAGLPLLARDRRAPGRALHPAPRLVPPRRAADRRVRILVLGDPRGGHAAVDRRHDLRPEPEPPRPRRGHGVRGARGGRSYDGVRELHVLPRAGAAPGDAAGHQARRVRAEPFLLLQPLRVRVTGAPLAVRNRARGSVDAYAAAVGAVARHPGRLRLLRLLPVRLRLRLPRDRPGRGDAGAGARRRCDRRALRRGRRPGRVLARYDLVLCSDHGQSDVARATVLERSYADTPNVVVTASNRAGDDALPGCPSIRGRS